jgi:hypothetical protein
VRAETGAIFGDELGDGGESCQDSSVACQAAGEIMIGAAPRSTEQLDLSRVYIAARHFTVVHLAGDKQKQSNLNYMFGAQWMDSKTLRL